MTGNGGANGDGTIFSIPVTGGTPTTLLSFNGTNGAHPLGSLTLSGSTLYGMTSSGGANGDGTVFSMNAFSTFTLGGSAVAVDSGVTVTSYDTDITGATETITDYQSGDTLNFTNQNGISGSYSAGVLTLSGSATPAQYQTALQSVTFSTTSTNTTTRSISIVALDGSLTSNSASESIEVSELATFSDSGTTLTLALATDEQLSIVSTGTSYSLSLGGTGIWSGADDANVTGNGSNTLTVTSAGISALTSGIDIADSSSGGGDSVDFSDSLASGYANSFVISLTNSSSGAATPGLAFSGSTSFVDDSAISATVNGDIIVDSGASLSTDGAQSASWQREVMPP